MPQMLSQTEITSAQNTAREMVRAFNAGPQLAEFGQNARGDGKSWVAATGRGSNSPQQTV